MLEAVLTPKGQIAADLTPKARIEAELRGSGGSVPDYEGAYEVTPSQLTQTLLTNGLRMVRDVIINPIPSNYGLITWDGNTLTVS